MPDAIQPNTRTVDYSALRTNQGFVVLLLVVGFLLDSWHLVALVAAVLLLGAALPAANLFKSIYFYLLRPSGIARPDVREDDPAPHRFAQGVGGTVTIASAAALASGWGLLGWSLSGIVVALASLNLFAGVCVGCLLYYQLGRLGVPGFTATTVRRS